MCRARATPGVAPVHNFPAVKTFTPAMHIELATLTDLVGSNYVLAVATKTAASLRLQLINDIARATRSVLQANVAARDARLAALMFNSTPGGKSNPLSALAHVATLAAGHGGARGLVDQRRRVALTKKAQAQARGGRDQDAALIEHQDRITAAVLKQAGVQVNNQRVGPAVQALADAVADVWP